MFRLLFILFLLFGLKGHATEKQQCDWTGVPIDKYGCVDFFWIRKADAMNCANMPECFKIGMEEDKPKKKDKKSKKQDDSVLEIPEPPKEYFKEEAAEQKVKIMPILDSSAVAFLKNSKLKDIKIIFYNKDGKLSKDFQKEAEKYLLDKGVKPEQFKIEIR